MNLFPDQLKTFEISTDTLGDRVLDYRDMLPFGAVMLEEAYCGQREPALALFAFINGERMHAEKAINLNLPRIRVAFSRDFYGKSPIVFTSARGVYDEKLSKRCQENTLTNKPIAKPLDFIPKASTVILCGSGPSIKAHADAIENAKQKGALVVTVGAAQRHVLGDVYIGGDSIPEHLENLRGAKTENTIGFFELQTYPEVVRLPWRDYGFFSHRNYDTETKVPSFFAGEHIAYSALQAAINYMGASNVILVGMEHWISDAVPLYYWHGKFIEAGAWWAAQHGVCVWNCSLSGSVFSGVKHASLNTALNEALDANTSCSSH